MTDELRDNAALFVLGLLDAEDRGTFVAAAREEAELTEIVFEYRAVLGVLALSVRTLEPPPALRSAILARISGSHEIVTDRITPTEAESASRPERKKVVAFPLDRIVPWAVAAGFAVASAILFVQVVSLKRENSTIVQQANLENLLFADLAPQTPELPDISARVAWNPSSGTGIIETADLPEQPDTLTYQMWVFEKDNPAPVSAGIFDLSAGNRIVFQPERPIDNAAAFAVSIEVAGGRPQPEGAVVLVGALQEG